MRFLPLLPWTAAAHCCSPSASHERRYYSSWLADGLRGGAAGGAGGRGCRAPCAERRRRAASSSSAQTARCVALLPPRPCPCSGHAKDWREEGGQKAETAEDSARVVGSWPSTAPPRARCVCARLIWPVLSPSLFAHAVCRRVSPLTSPPPGGANLVRSQKAHWKEHKRLCKQVRRARSRMCTCARAFAHAVAAHPGCRLSATLRVRAGGGRSRRSRQQQCTCR